MLVFRVLLVSFSVSPLCSRMSTKSPIFLTVHWEGGGEVVAAPADEEPEPPEPVEEEAEDSPKGDDDYDATVEEEPVKPRASRLRRVCMIHVIFNANFRSSHL
jgi:hypothetical protein